MEGNTDTTINHILDYIINLRIGITKEEWLEKVKELIPENKRLEYIVLLDHERHILRDIVHRYEIIKELYPYLLYGKKE